MNEPLIDSIKSRLLDARKILLTSHIRPDGDAVGSRCIERGGARAFIPIDPHVARAVTVVDGYLLI